MASGGTLALSVPRRRVASQAEFTSREAGPFQDHLRAGVEGDLGEASGQFEPLSFAQVVARLCRRIAIVPTAFLGASHPRHDIRRVAG